VQRALLALVTVLIAVPVAIASPGASSIRVSVTGEIAKLGMTKIAIGRTACTIPAKLQTRAGRFVISDPVKMMCLNGRLATIKYSPEIALAQTSTHVSQTSATPAPSSTGTTTPWTGGAPWKVSWSFGTIVLSRSSQPALATASATGTIAAFSADGITVDSLSCSVSAMAYNMLGSLAHVGDKVSIACRTDTGALTAAKSVS
jgi:hypothetical protein